jgi:hypothetical protein
MSQTAADVMAPSFPSDTEIQKACQSRNGDETRTVVEHMLVICRSVSATEDERQRARATIREALFPDGAAACDEFVDRLSGAPDAIAREREMDAEDQAFAERLREIMAAGNVTRDELARRSEFDAEAISILLDGRSRPQQRTVRRFAEALGVASEDLRPTGSSARR